MCLLLLLLSSPSIFVYLICLGGCFFLYDAVVSFHHAFHVVLLKCCAVLRGKWAKKEEKGIPAAYGVKCQGRDLPLMRRVHLCETGKLCFAAPSPSFCEKKHWCVAFECQWECIQRADITLHFLIHMYCSSASRRASSAASRTAVNSWKNYRNGGWVGGTGDEHNAPKHENFTFSFWFTLVSRLLFSFSSKSIRNSPRYNVFYGISTNTLHLQTPGLHHKGSFAKEFNSKGLDFKKCGVHRVSLSSHIFSEHVRIQTHAHFTHFTHTLHFTPRS